MDNVFADALFWLFNDYTLKTLLFGTVTSVALIIGFFHVVRKWGDF